MNGPAGASWVDLVLDPASGRFFIIDQPNKTIMAYNAETLAPSGALDISGYVLAGQYPQSIALHGGARRLYVTADNGYATGATTVLVFNADTFAYVTSLTGIGLSLSMAVDETRGRLFTFGSNAMLRKTLTATSTATNTVVGSLDLQTLMPSGSIGFTGRRAINPTTGELVFSNLHNDQLAVVNGATMTGSVLAPPNSRGWDATWNPQENKIYVTTENWNGYFVYDRDTGTSLTVACVNDGTSLFYSQATNRIYSGAEVNGDTTVIEGGSDACQNVEIAGGLADVAFIPLNRRAYFAGNDAIAVLDEDALDVVASIPNCGAAGYGGVATWIESDPVTRRVFVLSNWSSPSQGSCVRVVDDRRCPVVSGISPSAAPAGAQVVISGADLTGVSSVSFFGGAPAQLTVDSDTQLTVTVPAGAGTGPIIVRKPGCPDTATQVFTVIACQLTCSASVPATGQAGSPLLFDGSGTTASNCSTPPAFDWDFGDGSPHSSAVSPSHDYQQPGPYHWRLIVTTPGKTSTCEGDIVVGEACTVGCAATVPGYGKVGSAIQFEASATVGNCPGPVSFEWGFGDGSAPSAEQSAAHAFAAVGVFPWQLAVRVAGQTCTRSGFITIGAGHCTGQWTRFIPAAADNEGLNKTRWLSDVDLLNPADDPARVDLALLLKDRGNLTPQVAGVEVPARRTLRLTNVLGSIFQAPNAAIGIRFCDQEVLADSRFYNTGAGAGLVYGMYIDSVGDELALTPDELGYFHHLSYSQDPKVGSRVNIGFVNAVGFVVDLVVRLYDDDGILVGYRNVRLQPYDHRQYTRIHESVSSPTVTSGYATVEVLTPGGRVHPYAMLIENISGDPVYMPVKLVAR